MDCSTPGFSVPHRLPEFAQVHIRWINDAIQPFHPLSPSSSAFSFSQHQGLFQSLLCIRWPKYSVSAVVLPRLTSFRIDWFYLCVVQGTLKSLLQHHSLKASILWCSAFFVIQLSQPYLTSGKTIALTTWTFVSKVMSLLFKTLSRFVIAFQPRSNHLLISWLSTTKLYLPLKYTLSPLIGPEL